jgi:protease PrsW
MMDTTATKAVAFHCINGPDDQFSVTLEPGQSVRLGSAGTGADYELKSLETYDGNITLSLPDNLLQLQVNGSTVPVKINGSAVSTAVVRRGDAVRIGNSVWKVVYPQPVSQGTATASSSTPLGTNAISNHFTNLIGLEELKDFKLKSIFSQVFKKHTLGEMEDQLITGTMNSTPPLAEIEVGWAKPWLFFRMLVLTVALDFLLIVAFNMFQNVNLLPGIIFVGSFAVPFATLMFFLEMNAPRNISIFVMLVFLFAGGVLSLFVTLIFFDRLEFLSSWMGAPAAGIIEETAKLLCIVLFLPKLTRYKWVLNGLLIGAAVGTGFAAFESAGYALNLMLQNNSFSLGVDVIIMRGILAPFGHIIWTGNAAAALWLVKGDRPFSWGMLKDMRFLRVFLSSVLLHFLWDTSFTILPLPYVGDLKLLILGVIGWAITLRLIQVGLKQLNEARKLEVERLSAA